MGPQATVTLCDGQKNESLSSIRRRNLFKKMVTTKKFVNSDCLPRTSSSTKYHSLRVYYQVMTWLSKQNNMDG